MIDESAVSAAFNAARHLSSAEAFVAASTEVTTGLHRLEGAFYGSAGYKAIQQLRKSGLMLSTVGTITNIQWLGPMARTYVDSKEAGVPFLSSSDMMQAQLVPDKFVSKELTRRLRELLVEPGTILVSRSGTVGNVALCTADHDGIAVSEHAIRVRLRQSSHDLRGVVYCLLQSDLGQYLLTRNKSGSVIETLYADDVGSLPLPQLPLRFRGELTRLIDASCELRVKANRLLDEAQEQMQRSCYLPDLKTFAPQHAFGDGSSAEMFITSARARLSADHGFGEVRLDAKYHEPVALALRNAILGSDTGTELRNVVTQIRRSALRQRTYVEDATLGVPLVGGKELMHWRQAGSKYLSRALTRNLSKEGLEKDWTLVTCGGTIGRTMFVHKNYEGWCASEHIMRIVPDEEMCRPGFIYSFLASPFGQVQISQRIHGSVIPQIRDFEFGSIAIRIPKDNGEAVHDTVVRAFDLRADARASEDRAISLFEEAIRRGRSHVEAEWGTEY